LDMLDATSATRFYHPYSVRPRQSNVHAPSYTLTLSLHDALPISLNGPPRDIRAPGRASLRPRSLPGAGRCADQPRSRTEARPGRSEEHTSELQSRVDLVCRLLLEKKKEDVAQAASINA